jgi:hypothetical protein
MSDRYAGGGSTVVADPEPVDPAHRLRVLLGAALGSTLTSYLLMGTVAALAGLSAGAQPEPSALLTVGVPLWLAANQVPLMLAGAPLSVLPLLPSIAVAALAANFAAAAIDKLGRRWGGEAAWVVFALAGAQGSLAILGTALPIAPVQAEPWQALLGGGLVVGTGAVAGVLREVGLPDRWRTAPHWLRVALTSGATGAAGLLTAGALMLFAAFVAAVGTVHDGFDARPGWGAGIGVAVLSLCYLPNALVAAVSWLAGPGVDIGAATASPVGVTVGPLPPIPLLAAMPTSQPPGWAAAVFLLPAAVGVLVGLGCRHADADPMVRLRAVGVAILVVGVGFAALASVTGGRLAGGPFDPVDLSASSNALALLGWLGVPAMVTVLLPAGLGRRLRRKRVLSVEEAVAGGEGLGGVVVPGAEVSDAGFSDAEGTYDAESDTAGAGEADLYEEQQSYEESELYDESELYVPRSSGARGFEGSAEAEESENDGFDGVESYGEGLEIAGFDGEDPETTGSPGPTGTGRSRSSTSSAGTDPHDVAGGTASDTSGSVG